MCASPRHLAVAALALLCTGTSSSSYDPLGQGDALDEIGLARVADEAGDAALAAELGDPRRRARALVAARASLYARAPEALVPALAALACGRDPALAPEAGEALARIAGRLHASELSAREVLLDDLRAARRALACADAAPRPRADIVAQLAQLALALDALLR